MYSFIIKGQTLSLLIFLMVFAFAKSQSTIIPEFEEYIITADDDRSKLLVLTDLLKSKYGIKTKFKDYKLKKGKLTDLEIDFFPFEGESSSWMVKGDNGIESQSIVINLENNQIIYAGAKSGFTPAKDGTAATSDGKAELRVTYVKVSEGIKSKESVPDNSKVNEFEVSKSNNLKSARQSKAADAVKKAQEEGVAKEKQQMKIAAQRVEADKVKAYKQEALKKEAESTLKAAKANAQVDAESKKKSLEELKRIQAKELKDQAEKKVIDKRYVFINSKAYNYKIAQGKTFVLDESGRTVLVLPAELSKQPFSGTIPLNRLRYQFSLRDNVISLFNGAGETVDITGKEL